mmetsp:Transcript_1721/g.6450  ORF Transcript_1721/g.6450 Transcript_1721/m.6450 type:complete len:174 (-) Transcript_1721:789-1310(-)
MNVGIDTHVDDLRNFENNVRRNVNELRRTRWKFVVLFAVLLVLSVCIFVEVATGPKYSQTPALWVLAWLSLGILPLALFFSFGLQANLISVRTKKQPNISVFFDPSPAGFCSFPTFFTQTDSGTPLLLFTQPEMYVRRINKALAPFNIAYDGQDDKLFRVDGRPRETVNSSPT